MNFAEAYQLAIGEHVEKKGKFSYLSWAYAVRFLREHYPSATWRIHENEAGLPIFSLGESHFVKITVILNGQEFTQWHPILDNNNRPIKEPSTFHINTSIQRGLTKAIGLATGIGLALYAGEDLPKEGDEGDQQKPTDQSKMLAAYDKLVDGIDWFDKQGKTSDALMSWYNTDAKAQGLKTQLDADNLSKANKYLSQIVDVMNQKKAA